MSQEMSEGIANDSFYMGDENMNDDEDENEDKNDEEWEDRKKREKRQKNKESQSEVDITLRDSLSFSVRVKEKNKTLQPNLLGLSLPKQFLTSKWLLISLCFGAIVQGMIFTNVVISSIEKRFGLQSTKSGIIAGTYDIGSLLAVIPITYFGGRPGASKPKYISWGMFIVGTGSFIFALPHFLAESYIKNIQDIGLTHNETSEEIQICSSSSLSSYNTSSSRLCNEISDSSNLSNYFYVFLLAQLLHGIGSAALITLGTTLLDESIKKSSVPLFIGILNACFVMGPALGYLIGGQFLNIFTEFYAKEASLLQIDSSSSHWVGAWWIGFLLILVLSYFFAFIIGLYPASIPGSEKSEINQIMDSDDPSLINRCDYGKLSELPKAIHILITNNTYILISLGAAMDGFLLAALAAFLPKYMESQFNITPGYAAILIGLIIVPAGTGGTLLGGYIVKRFSLNRSKNIILYIICQISILPLYLGFLLHCPNIRFAGVNYPYSSSNGITSLKPETFFMADCNANCSCSAVPYTPVCGSDGITYFNPCFAACTYNINSTVFTHCNCIHDERSQTALTGSCAPDCDFKYFALLLFCQIFFTFMATMPGLVASLRSVEPLHRSLSLGIQTILIRGFGTIPGPIIFGYILDSTCFLWQQDKCDTKGNCLLYDHFKMSRYILIVLLFWRLGCALFFGGALYHSKKSKIEDS